eukprot:TCONS_00049307-protein
MNRAQLSWVNHEHIAPKIEKDIPSYAEEKTEETKPSPPSYLERILSMTADIEEIKQPEDDGQETTSVGVSTEEYHGDNKDMTPPDLKVMEINEEGIEPEDEHSEILRQAKFEWLIPKDFGTFQVVHYDRPTVPDPFNDIIQSVMEENSSNKNRLSVNQSKRATPKSPRTPRTPLSARSTTSGPPAPKPLKGKERVLHADKVYNLLMELDQNNRNISQSYRTKSPVLAPNWLISSRPISSNSFAPLPEINATTKKQKKKKTQKEVKFTTESVRRTISKVLEENLRDKAYDAEYFKTHLCILTDIIKSKIKRFYGPRYRVICNMNVFEIKGQSVRTASRCCWDTERDNFTECIFEGNGFSITFVAYGVYLE